MIKIFSYDYDFGEAQCTFKVDTDKFTPAKAKETLDFFLWDQPVDPDADPVEEYLNKCAVDCVAIGTANGLNRHGVKDRFKDREGWFPLDGSHGVELIEFVGYEFEESKLQVEITES